MADNVVWLLVSKGNLRHRIAKLGTEINEAELSRVQYELRRVALAGAEAGKFGNETPPERPGWANGAFLYVEPEHAAAIEGIVKQYGLKLQSKHVLTSEGCRHLVTRALQEGPEGPGREAFLMRRAGFVEKAVPMPLPTMRPLVLLHVRPGLVEERRSCVTPDAFDEGLDCAKSWEVLREIAETSKSSMGCPSGDSECPTWARGTYVYLHQEHIEQGSFEHVRLLIDHGYLLYEKSNEGRVLTSWQYRPLVERALGLNPQADGLSTEAFLNKRAEVIVREEAVPDYAQLQECLRMVEERSAAFKDGVVDGTAGYESRDADDHGTPCQNVLLITLDESIMCQKDIDIDLLEFLTSPASVQMLDTEMWLTAWHHVCAENTWLEMRDAGPMGDCPYDTLCKKWAAVPHLLSSKCQEEVIKNGHTIGPLLAAILEAWDKANKDQCEPGKSSEKDTGDAASEDDSCRIRVSRKDEEGDAERMGISIINSSGDVVYAFDLELGSTFGDLKAALLRSTCSSKVPFKLLLQSGVDLGKLSNTYPVEKLESLRDQSMVSGHEEIYQ